MRVILVMVGFVFLSSCGYGYKLKDSKVYWYYSNEGVGSGKRLISDADADSLKILKINAYAKDKSSAYYEGKKIEGVDLSTFKPLDRIYSVDKNFAYYGSKLIKGSDGRTFSIIEEGWAKDKNDVYYQLNALGVCDLETFNIRKEYYNWWATDSKCVYFQNKKIPIRDPKSIEILQDGYSKDKYHVYFYSEIIQGADPETFRSKYRPLTAEDKDACYYAGEKSDCNR